jgi:hypothetical protein
VVRGTKGAFFSSAAVAGSLRLKVGAAAEWACASHVPQVLSARCGRMIEAASSGFLVLRAANVCMYVLREASQGVPLYLDPGTPAFASSSIAHRDFCAPLYTAIMTACQQPSHE